MKPYIDAVPAAPQLATVDDITQIVGFLAEEQSRWIMGNTMRANG